MFTEWPSPEFIHLVAFFGVNYKERSLLRVQTTVWRGKQHQSDGNVRRSHESLRAPISADSQFALEGCAKLPNR
jgi:hypothetical protein